MSTLIVPGDDGETYWPTLGWYVAEFLTGWDYLRNSPSQRWEGSVFGPGSLKGEDYRLDDEKLAITLRAYEIFPPSHKLAGRRRFKRVGKSVRKGTAKTEWAAQIALAELHPSGPVRFNGWEQTKTGELVRDPYTGCPLPRVGRAVRDPYIPMMAYTEEQTEELAYGALKVIIENGPWAHLFDIGLERILRLDERRMPDGKAEAVATSPNASDGARTTFQHFDETHRMDLPRHVSAHKVMLANIPKRPLDDPWSLETTTAGQPGAGSVAEGTHKYAEKIASGGIKTGDARLFYFHRQASDKWDLSKFEDRVKAISEATGPVGEYAPGQFEEIAAQWDEPDADRAYLERVWCNRWTQMERQAFNVSLFEELSRPIGKLLDTNRIPDGAFCTGGFDGARFKDSTAMVLTEIDTGKQMVVGLWENREQKDGWEVPVLEVHEKFHEVMQRFKIWRFYCDPPYWVEDVAKWAMKYPDVVIEWWTNNKRKVARAARSYQEAITGRQVHPAYDPDFVRHVGNAGKVETNLMDEEGRKVWILGKLRPEAKFDVAMAAVLSWQARIDALADGATAGPDLFVPYRIR